MLTQSQEHKQVSRLRSCHDKLHAHRHIQDLEMKRSAMDNNAVMLTEFSKLHKLYPYFEHMVLHTWHV